jgi:hypothetical protein
VKKCEAVATQAALTRPESRRFDVFEVVVAQVEGVELVAVEGNFDAGVAGLFDFVDGGQEVEVGQAEGAVAEANHVVLRLGRVLGKLFALTPGPSPGGRGEIFEKNGPCPLSPRERARVRVGVAKKAQIRLSFY